MGQYAKAPIDTKGLHSAIPKWICYPIYHTMLMEIRCRTISLHPALHIVDSSHGDTDLCLHHQHAPYTTDFISLIWQTTQPSVVFAESQIHQNICAISGLLCYQRYVLFLAIVQSLVDVGADRHSITYLTQQIPALCTLHLPGLITSLYLFLHETLCFISWPHVKFIYSLIYIEYPVYKQLALYARFLFDNCSKSDTKS